MPLAIRTDSKTGLSVCGSSCSTPTSTAYNSDGGRYSTPMSTFCSTPTSTAYNSDGGRYSTPMSTYTGSSLLTGPTIQTIQSISVQNSYGTSVVSNGSPVHSCNVQRLVINAGLKHSFRISELQKVAMLLEKNEFTTRDSLKDFHDVVAFRLGVPSKLAVAIREEAEGPPPFTKFGKVAPLPDDEVEPESFPHLLVPETFASQLRCYSARNSSPNSNARSRSSSWRAVQRSESSERAYENHVYRQNSARDLRHQNAQLRISSGRFDESKNPWYASTFNNRSPCPVLGTTSSRPPWAGLELPQRSREASKEVAAVRVDTSVENSSSVKIPTALHTPRQRKISRSTSGERARTTRLTKPLSRASQDKKIEEADLARTYPPAPADASRVYGNPHTAERSSRRTLPNRGAPFGSRWRDIVRQELGQQSDKIAGRRDSDGALVISRGGIQRVDGVMTSRYTAS